MKILKVAVGNSTEAFVENGFSDKLNIISSDDNNKGKTIVMQTMMYALGNEPTFPTSFNYKDYYHYVEFEVGKITYCLCRYNNGFVLKHGTTLMLFDNVSELKRYWHKKIFSLPNIVKSQIPRIVDPVLFLQVFFVGQDKKDTSNISNAGFYNKDDFYNMLYDMCDLGGLALDQDEIRKIQDKLVNLKNEQSLLIKQHKILKSQDVPVSYLSSVNDKVVFEKKLQELEKINAVIAELRKERNAAATRKASWETTLKELRSLNRTIECGQLRCMDCNSTNILFSSAKRNAYAFDVSSANMRNEIVSSINEKIESYSEEIERLSAQISNAQKEMKILMGDDAISLEAIVAYKKDIFCAADAEEKLKTIDAEVENLKSMLQMNKDATRSKQGEQLAVLASILKEMNGAYKKIDPDGNQKFDDLFSKRGMVYSGSEEIIFYLSRLYALRMILKHDYPIVVDSFRAEDLSSDKESVVLDMFKMLPNQIIFTTTLKKEEIGKYDANGDIHHISYNDHTPSKILSEKYVANFRKLLSDMSVELDGNA